MKRKNKLSRHILESGRDRTQKGAVLAMVAISLFALLGISALVFDVGNAYQRRTTLQTALDAAALSTAISTVTGRLANAPTDGRATFTNFVTNNNFPITSADIDICFFDSYPAINAGCAQTVATAATRFVRVSNNVPFSLTTWFAGVVGINTLSTNASAVAGHLPLNYLCNVIPVMACIDPLSTLDCTGVVQGGNCYGYIIGDEYTLKQTNWQPTTALPGNFGFMDVGSGAASICDALASNRFCFDFGTQALTKPGGSSGPTACANVRFDNYTHGRLPQFPPAQFPPDLNIVDLPGGGKLNNYLTGAPLFQAPSHPGQQYRRIVSTPFTNCSLGGTGATLLDVEGIGCWLLTREVIEGGPSPDKFSLFLEFIGDTHSVQGTAWEDACGLDAQATPDNNTASFLPQRIVLYKDRVSPDA